MADKCAPVLEVVAGGIAVMTDLGRASGPNKGLPVNGALDQHSARIANILVANDDASPLVEVTAFDFSCTVSADSVVAVTGAPVDFAIDGVMRDMYQPHLVRAGQMISFQAMRLGMRTYLAVHGSFDVPLLLGSAAPDTVVEFGTVLKQGSIVPLRDPAFDIANPFFDTILIRTGLTPPRLHDDIVIDVTDGPDINDFGDSVDALFDAPFVVGPKSNHIGLRFTGEYLPRRVTTDEKVSRGVPIGAIEVPAGDELLVLHRGRGVTAGYPVLAVVTPTSLDRLGQVRPGDSVTFRRIPLDTAGRMARHERDEIDRARERITTAYTSLAELRRAPIHLSERTPL